MRPPQSKCQALAAAGLFILLAMMAMTLPTFARAGQPAQGGSVKTTGDLLCSGPITYRFGTGLWLSNSGGRLPVVLPVEIRTGASSCRITLPDYGLLEAAANSEFILTSNGGQRYGLKIERGSVLYGLKPGRGLAVSHVTPPVTAKAGVAPSAGATLAANVESPQADQMGVVRASDRQGLEINNISGSVNFTQSDGSARQVKAGQRLVMQTAESDGISIFASKTAANSPGAQASSPWTSQSANPHVGMAVQSCTSGGGSGDGEGDNCHDSASPCTNPKPKPNDNDKEKAEKEKAEKEKAAKEQAAKEQAAREQAAKEQAAKEQAAREQAAREQAAKEQAAKEKAAKEQAAKDKAAKDKLKLKK